MSDYVLRAEGLNFDNTVFNSADISTIRGASLTLEMAVQFLLPALESRKPSGVVVSDLSSGASIACFKLSGCSAAEANDIKDLTENILSAPKDYGLGRPEFEDHQNTKSHLNYIPAEHMTWLVELAEVKNENRPEHHAALRAQSRIRRRQLMAPTVPLVEATDIKPLFQGGRTRFDMVCPIDQRLPVGPGAFDAADENEADILVKEGQYARARIHAEAEGKSERIRASKRTADLRAFGRTARWQMYQTLFEADSSELAALDDVSFSQSFEMLVEEPPDEPAISVRSKVAYLYFDGIGFGSLLNSLGLEVFSSRTRDLMQQIQKQLAKHFLYRKDDESNRVYAVNAWDSTKRADRPHLRYETLMVGGEDLLVVVPAWLAFDTVIDILGWVEEHEKGLDHPMRLRCGAYITDSGTPVHGARGLAHDLCDGLRDYLKLSGQEFNCAQFHIVESVEVPDDAIGDQRSALYGTDTHKAFGFSLDQLKKTRDDVVWLKRRFPRSQLYKIIDRISDDVRRDDLLAKISRRADGELEDLPGRLPKGDADPDLFGKGKIDAQKFGLKLLADYWDYIDPMLIHDQAKQS